MREFGQFDAEFFKVEARDLFVEVFGQGVHADRAFICPQVHLGQNLIGKGIGHHKGRVPGCTAEVDQPAFGEQKEGAPVWKRVFIDPRFDVFPRDARVSVELLDLYFVVEMPDVANDGLVAHVRQVFDADNVRIARRGDKDIGFGQGVFHSRHLKPFHGGLQRADRIDFRYQHARAKPAHGLGTPLAHIAVPADAHHFAGHHHIGGAFDPIGERFAAAVEVVEFRFGDRIVDIDRRKEERALAVHLIEAMDARRGLFRDALNVGDHVVPKARMAFELPLEHGIDDLEFAVVRGFVQNGWIAFGPIPPVDEQCRIAPIIDDQGWAARWKIEGLQGAFPIFCQRFALPCIDGRAGLGNGGGGVVLRGKNIARCPAHIRAECLERFDQHRGLNRHVKRSGDARAAQGALLRVLFAHRHQAGHFALGNRDFPAPKIRERLIGHFVGQVRIIRDLNFSRALERQGICHFISFLDRLSGEPRDLKLPTIGRSVN